MSSSLFNLFSSTFLGMFSHTTGVKIITHPKSTSLVKQELRKPQYFAAVMHVFLEMRDDFRYT
jgi:hypothetical protein